VIKVVGAQRKLSPYFLF